MWNNCIVGFIKSTFVFDEIPFRWNTVPAKYRYCEIQVRWNTVQVTDRMVKYCVVKCECSHRVCVQPSPDALDLFVRQSKPPRGHWHEANDAVCESIVRLQEMVARLHKYFFKKTHGRVVMIILDAFVFTFVYVYCTM